MDATSSGNSLLLLETPEEVRVLKVYRSRRGRTREAFSCFSHLMFEGKRSPTPVGREETERTALELWAKHGFDVPRILPGPPPDWLGDHPFLWLEYVAGQPLHLHLLDPAVSEEEKLRLARSLGKQCQRRHALALELSEPLLLHEHPTTKHVLVSGQRMVTIDLEGGFSPGYPAATAAGQEVAGFARSLWRSPDERPFDEVLPKAFLEGYDDPQLLREIALAATSGPVAVFRRWSDRRRRRRPKSAVLSDLLARTS